MRRWRVQAFASIWALIVALPSVATSPPAASRGQTVSLLQLSRAQLRSAQTSLTKYRGSTALQLIPRKPSDPDYVKGGPLAVLNGIRFRNGVIEVDVAGSPAKGADESARGFIGIAFRVQSNTRYEIIYLRPTNSHADDQLRRNHTTQYSSDPDWPWDRLRNDSPGVYESWVDMNPGEWTHMRIVVHGTEASLFVNRASNACLVVHNLKLGDIEGGVGLWMGEDTEG